VFKYNFVIGKSCKFQRNLVWKCRMGSCGSEWIQLQNCQQGNEPLGSVKGKDLVDQLRNNHLIIISNRSGQLQPTGRPHNTDLPECRMCGYMYQKFQGGLNYLESHYLQTLSYLKEKAVGGTNLSKTQRMISLLFAVLRVMSLFSNIFSANKIAIICFVHRL